MHFLSQGSLLSDDSSLCQIDIKLASTHPYTHTSYTKLKTRIFWMGWEMLWWMGRVAVAQAWGPDIQNSINLGTVVQSEIPVPGKGNPGSFSHTCTDWRMQDHSRHPVSNGGEREGQTEHVRLSSDLHPGAVAHVCLIVPRPLFCLF